MAAESTALHRLTRACSSPTPILTLRPGLFGGFEGFIGGRLGDGSMAPTNKDKQITATAWEIRAVQWSTKVAGGGKAVFLADPDRCQWVRCL